MNEAVTPATFGQLSKEVVERFLQTVVVLDDGAFMGPAPVPVVREPEENTPIREEGPEDLENGAGAPEAGVPSANALDADALISGFAARGLVCAVLAPGTGDDGSEVIIGIARRADIVIVDWQLSQEASGEVATGIIRRIKEEDGAAGGRLRMLVVYTANPDLESVRAEVSGVIDECVPSERPGGVLALKAEDTTILFVRKGSTTEVAGRIGEPDLPGRLIDEFVEMGNGILANVTFGCIAAIREETHRVLARFHRGMDGPFVTHRILLATPDDAEDYAVELVCSEVLAVLRSSMVGARYAGREAIQLALGEREARGDEFRLMTQKDSAEGARTITAEDFMKLVDAGPRGLAEIVDNGGTSSQQRRLYERVHLLLFPDVAAGMAAHREFARISACVREQGHVPAGYRATLSLGTIVRVGDEYFVCIQPACEAVRLEGPTQFLFAGLSDGASSFDVMVKDALGQELGLRLNTQSSAIRGDTFRPDPGSGTVRSAAENGMQTFTSISDEEFVWACDLRRSLAQRFVHRIASSLSRVGLDEFEWQRRQSPSR